MRVFAVEEPDSVIDLSTDKRLKKSRVLTFF